jgi:SHS2 domain-containing protein
VQRYRILEHTADVGFEAQGRTLAEVFRNAGLALMSLIIDPVSVRPMHFVTIPAEARDSEGLLVNWLSEILYLQDAEGWLFSVFNVDELTEHKILGTGQGERYNRDRHHFKLLVKAITYHQLVLEKKAEGYWRAQVYVDI